MSELLPTVQALDLQDGLVDFLTTTFALVDADARAALEDFLRHVTEGIFKGPYVRLRLPFRPAGPGWRDPLDWAPEGFVPYGHQAAAFARLSSKLTAPEPTLVTTGTGSGKTEAFLYPLIDHVLRARAAGVTGTKALVLYPMNALATDQAGRLAALLAADPRLAAVTAALFIGDSGPDRTMVTSESLITDRGIIRDTAPDIVLTNYKMLDQLLLRHEDQALWQQSADSLTYVVLDEFHTYDGAQGTDVAMLLRRLALALEHGRDADDPRNDEPLAGLVPVATSATLGDAGDPAAMISFATTVFGVPFDRSCVVTESRRTAEEWSDGASTRVAAAALSPTPLAGAAVAELNRACAATEADGAALAQVVLEHLYGQPSADLARLPTSDLVRGHPQLATLVAAAAKPRSLDDLAAAVLGSDEDPAEAQLFVSFLIACLSHVRATTGRDEISVDTHLWVRELTRIDRVAAGLPAYRWSDDGGVSASDLLGAAAERPTFPAVYCRHCGRSGWGVELAPTGSGLAADDRDIRGHHAAGEGRFRALLHAPQEAAAEAAAEGMAWLNTRTRELSPHEPAAADDDLREGWLLPVLTLVHDPEEESRRDRCPACDQPDGIRFLGSAIATLLSVSLSSLFGAPHLDRREKKALVFTDSVQDAAHRAGFVESRSYTLTLRAAIRAATASEPTTLPQLVDTIIAQAGDDPSRRYRLLAPDLIGRQGFDPFWQVKSQQSIPERTRDDVRLRLLFDLACEFGVQSRIGRTLEVTGSVVAEVDAGPADQLAAAGRGTLEEAGYQGTLLTAADDTAVTAWVRGTLEHLRTQGAIFHQWLGGYLDEDGSRYRIWGGRAREHGMPAFPTGRTAPAFPRIGPRLERGDPLLDAVTSPQSWYARWTARVLDVPPGHGARLARALLERLHRDGILQAHTTRSQATVYSIPADRVLVASAEVDGTGPDASSGDHRLVCSLCRTEQAGSAAVVRQLRGAPCLLVRCGGRLVEAPVTDNYYRRLYAASDPQRIVAREHSAMLEPGVRLAYETGFKAGGADPSAPNVLVATPTLEMGIDIGDLSSVLLASLPRHVASYLQRIGRAGRLTGNSLNLAFVTGRGQHLPQLGDPLSMIDGPVRPPATYLDAEEILRRQYLASLVDDFARDDDRPHPRTAPFALGSADPGSFLGELTHYAETDSDRLLDRFLRRFPQLTDESAASLRSWAVADGTRGNSGLARQVEDASFRWRTAVAGLDDREVAIRAALPELEQREHSPAATEDDERAARAARSALRQTGAALGVLRGRYWVGVLEEYGLLPNYTLLDDSVTLDVALSWLDPETQQYDSMTSSHQRSSAVALSEFAPGATFYARGLEIDIDALDLGVDGGAVTRWSFCAACGFAAPTETVASACPRCSSTSVTDVQQRFDAVELTRVSAQAHRDEARISDRSDERRRARFTVLTAVDADPDGLAGQWFVDGYAFGARYFRSLTIRWLNVGPRVGFGTPRTIAGDRQPGNLFRVCAGCGVLDRASRANRPDEHRAWCRYRTSTDEHTETVLLTRTLVTQGVVIPLPWSVSLGDAFALPSLAAALLLGLRESFGGSPDHIRVVPTIDPVLGGDNREALLLHDQVRGGTGYLAELAVPERVWALLRKAWQVVAACPCAGEGRLACHRCLLPFAPAGRPDAVSRAAAERHLRAILNGGSGRDEPPETMTWVCTTEAPAPASSWESHLEQHFREAFLQLVRELSGTVTEQPDAYGNTLHVTFHGTGGGRTWLLEPQVTIGQARPDFVLRSTDTQLPSVVIFTDGYAFHAAPDRDLGADARLRSDLTAAGHLVLSITAADLREPTAPTWYSPESWPVLVRRAPTVVGVQEQLTGGPLAFLRTWLLEPDDARQRALADVLPYLFAGGATPVSLDPDAALDRAALDLQAERPAPSGSSSGLLWRRGALTVLVRLTAAGGTVRTEVAAVLDDTPPARHQPDFPDSWRDWLRLANSLQRHTIAATVTTRILVQSPDVASVPAPATSRLEPAWAAVRAEMIDDRGRDLIEALAAAGAELPSQVGEEFGAARIPADLAWESHHLVVLTDPEEDDVQTLTRDGWTVVAPDPELVLAALASTTGRP
ncbi:DEAD/DEAH box helicase [uncultured Friedmanniella sp.]|uniref:DEAD/DEAH box helicase n=1 Tax=uncultured Friedmanniella sp. TaxID=335381 RepID=UPI0035CBB734